MPDPPSRSSLATPARSSAAKPHPNLPKPSPGSPMEAARIFPLHLRLLYLFLFLLFLLLFFLRHRSKVAVSPIPSAHASSHSWLDSLLSSASASPPVLQFHPLLPESPASPEVSLRRRHLPTGLRYHRSIPPPLSLRRCQTHRSPTPPAASGRTAASPCPQTPAPPPHCCCPAAPLPATRTRP